VIVIELVHNFDLQFDLLDQVVLQDFLLVDDLDCEHVFALLVPDLVHLAESTDANVGVGEGLEVILAALSLLALSNGRRQKQDPIFDFVALILELLWDFNWYDDWLFLFSFAHN